ncbi:MAG: hypothetical protein WCP29_06205 [Acidobacteriota bacterium]
MKRLLAALILLTGSAATAWAQPSANATIGGTFSSFRGGQTTQDSRQDVTAAAGVEQAFDQERGRVYYDFDGGTYASSGDWSYYLHTAGFTYRIGGAEDTDRRLYFNGAVVVRRNGSAWAAADYTAVGAGVNAEFHPLAALTVRTGYRADRRSFNDASALTHTQHDGFLSVLANLPTRTTLIGEIHGGAKAYGGQTVVTSTIADVSGVTVGQMQGRGMGPGLRGSTLTQSQLVTQDGAAGLVSGLFRIAQSVSDRTGVFAQATGRTTFGNVAPGLITTPAGFFDDGVYDDPFASDAITAQAGVTHQFANGTQLQGSASWADRRYTSTAAVDATWIELPGSPLRRDQLWRASATWSQPVLASRTGAAALTLDLGYRLVRSRSNDAFYSYTSHGVGVGLSLAY